METRKIQKVGRSTHTVSLPADWVRRVRVKEGEMITFSEQTDGSLLLQPFSKTEAESRREAVEVIVNSDMCDEHGILERIIVGGYVIGHDTIRIVSSTRISHAHLEEVRGIVQKLVGLGIMEETDKQILVQSATDPTRFPVDLLIRRLYTIASTMCKEAMDALTSLDSELLKTVATREQEADKLYWLTVRILSLSQLDREVGQKVGIDDPRHIVIYRLVAHHLERMADWSEIISTNVLGIKELEAKLDAKTIKRLQQLGESAQSICDRAIKALFRNDIKIASNVVEEYKTKYELQADELAKEIKKMTSDPTIRLYLRSIVWAIRRISELGAETAEVAANKSLEKSTKICDIRGAQ